jgi:hypothetical protein
MLYRRARQSHIETVKFLLEAGAQLRRQKEALAHGEWLLWIQAHKSELGFGDVTAQRLMRASLEYTSLTTDLDDDKASQLNRLVWRNEPEPSPYPNDGPPVAYWNRFGGWTVKTSPELFDGLPDDAWSDLETSFSQVEAWIARVRARRVVRRVA